MAPKRTRDAPGSSKRPMKKRRTFPKRASPSKMGEIKGVDTDINDTSVLTTTNTSGDIVALNLVRSGTNSWERIGKKVNLKSVRLTGEANFEVVPAATTGLYDTMQMRICLVWDKQPNGAAIPNFDAIFGTTDQAGTEATGSVLDALKFDVMKRFTILRDHRITVPAMSFAPGTTPTASVAVPFDLYVPLKDREVVFGGQSSPMTYTDIYSGGLLLVYRATAVTYGSAVVRVTDATARLRYSD